MSKVKLKEIINELERIRLEYKQKFGKEPQVWDMDTFSSDFESIELCHSYRKFNVGHTASDIVNYELELE